MLEIWEKQAYWINKNCKTQVHVRVREENKLELELEEKNDAYWHNFVVEGASLKII